MAALAVCRGAAVMPTFDVVPNWCAKDDDHQHRPAQLDMWNIAVLPADNEKAPAAKKPYVHPLVRRRSMSHKSLEVCTESLGCETGSGDFLSVSLFDDTMGMGMPWLCAPSPAQPEAEEEPTFLPPAMALDLVASKLGDDDKLEQQAGEGRISKDELTAVHYHCSRPQRAFPPPLPSMSRRDGPCLQMRPHRRDGRLVVQAVPVGHQGYLHAQRQRGRLRLCFVDCSLRVQSTTTSNTQEAEQEEGVETEQQDQHDDEEEEEEIVEEEHEEVEVVDRGTVVEVTVSSTQTARRTDRGSSSTSSWAARRCPTTTSQPQNAVSLLRSLRLRRQGCAGCRHPRRRWPPQWRSRQRPHRGRRGIGH